MTPTGAVRRGTGTECNPAYMGPEILQATLQTQRIQFMPFFALVMERSIQRSLYGPGNGPPVTPRTRRPIPSPPPATDLSDLRTPARQPAFGVPTRHRPDATPHTDTDDRRLRQVPLLSYGCHDTTRQPPGRGGNLCAKTPERTSTPALRHSGTPRRKPSENRTHENRHTRRHRIDHEDRRSFEPHRSTGHLPAIPDVSHALRFLNRFTTSSSATSTVSQPVEESALSTARSASTSAQPPTTPDPRCTRCPTKRAIPPSSPGLQSPRDTGEPPAPWRATSESAYQKPLHPLTRRHRGF